MARSELDPRGVAYPTVTQDPSTYWTTNSLAHKLNMYPETVWKWCVKWFGTLPPGRGGPKMGYRIPREYLLVARAWLLSEEPQVRRAALKAILDSPKKFVVVVADRGSTHYSVGEVVERIESLLPYADRNRERVTILPVGDMENPS